MKTISDIIIIKGLISKKQGIDPTQYFKKTLSLNPDFEPAKQELKI